MHTMSSSEEQVAFYFELGLAITHWANIERELSNLASLCVTLEDRNLLALGFFSIENFRSKAAFVDQVFNKKYDGSKFLADWATLFERALTLSKSRNKLAHFNVMNFPQQKAGRRVSLQPWINPKPKTEKERLRPVPDALCLRDIVGIRFEFLALAISLSNFRDRVLGRKELFLKSSEQPMRPPTIQKIKDQIHAMLGHQRISSRQKRKLQDEENAKASLAA